MPGRVFGGYRFSTALDEGEAAVNAAVDERAATISRPRSTPRLKRMLLTRSRCIPAATAYRQQYLIEWRNANREAPDAWLRGIICEAFKRMIARRMQDAPAADVIATVAEDWIDIVGEGMTEELDRERIIAGFKLIFRECRRWPQPAELLKRLPRRPSAPLRDRAVNVDAVDEGQHERSAEAIDAILESLT